MSQSKGQKRENYINWEDFFMGVAVLAAKRSKDPKCQAGACIVNDENTIISVGYNSFPTGCSDDKFPWASRKEDPRNNIKHYVCHAELNAILFSKTPNLKGCKIYVTRFPCCECAKLIIQSGIREVIYRRIYKTEEASEKMFHSEAANVDYRPYQPTIENIEIALDANW